MAAARPGHRPRPGDPQAVSAEAARLASVAATITGQVAAMHKIATDNTEVGQHAETIRAAGRSEARMKSQGAPSHITRGYLVHVVQWLSMAT